MERKIGEIFEYNGEWYQCIGNPYNECTDCDFCFESGRACVRKVVGQCSMSNRSDGLSVVFKKLEKVGYSMPPMYITDYKHKRIAIEIKQNKEDMEEKKVKLDKLVTDYTSNKITYNEFEKAVKELYSDKEESKSTLKEFDLESAKSGKPVCTRDGRKARIICFDRNDLYPIVALIGCEDGKEIIGAYSKKGQTEIYEINGTDLMMLPEKKEGWVNVYKGGLLDVKSYPTKKEAFDKACPEGYVDTIKINWEE